HVTGLVRRFDMDEDQIIFLQRAHAIFALTDVIGIEKSGDTRHIDALEPGVNAQTMDNIYGGNDAAFDAETLRQRRQLRRFPLPPEPNGRGLPVPLLPALFIHRMSRENRP